MEGERKYWVDTTAGGRELLPYSDAKKLKKYPDWCVSLWHEAADHPVRAQRGSNLCGRCSELLREAWQTIADRWQDLEEVLAVSRQSRAGERTSSSAVLGSPLPFDADVSEVMGLARSAVWSTIGCLLDDRTVSMPADHSTAVLAGWLAKWQVDYVAAHPSNSHPWNVLKEAFDVAALVKREAYQAGPAEVSLSSLCTKWTVDAAGGRVPCKGELVGVERADGSKVVECSEDSTHSVPFNIWLQVNAQRQTHRAKVGAKLQSRYARRKQ